MPLRISAIAGALALALAGCVSSHMQQFVGRDVADIVAVDGQPHSVEDIAPGSRAYQWYWGGGSFVVPAQSFTTTTGSVGASGFLNAQSQTTTFPGGVYSSPGCLITYFARKKGDRWIVEKIHYPARLVC